MPGSPLLEAGAYVVAAIGVLAFVLVLVLGVLWIGDLFEQHRRDLYPSTHIAGPDDEDLDFGAALRSIGGPR
jgi:hypothetical protein